MAAAKVLHERVPADDDLSGFFRFVGRVWESTSESAPSRNARAVQRGSTRPN
jgi:hypothetical protein